MDFKNNIYSILFESIQEGLIVVNKKGEIVLSNSVCQKLFGYSRKELKGQKIELLVPTDLRKKHTNQRETYYKKPTRRAMGSSMKLSGQRKDGSVFPVEISLNPFEENGEKFVAALISNVTIRREAEEKLIQLTQNLESKVQERTKELWKSEQLYKSIARNFPGGVISIFDRSFNYLFAEGQGLYELGIETDDLIGQDYLSRLEPSARSKVKEELTLVFKGDSRSFEVMVNQGTYLINAVPLLETDGNIERILVVEKNITAQKEVADRLEENLSKEKELSELKSRFVSMASHEFRTPLTTISSSAGLIRKYHEKNRYEHTPKHVNRIKGAVQNLTTILNDFLSLEKLESGSIQVKTSDFDLVDLVKDISDEMNGIIKEGQVIKFNTPKELMIVSDKQLLKNILINLFSNAIKYSPEGKNIITHIETTAKHIIIKIQDFGIGIPSADQEKMFDRFFRAGNVMNIEGTGLGLNIVVKYLELLNGAITFTSEENKGTTFIVTLPNTDK